jgi:hypothetical protein
LPSSQDLSLLQDLPIKILVNCARISIGPPEPKEFFVEWVIAAGIIILIGVSALPERQRVKIPVKKD